MPKLSAYLERVEGLVNPGQQAGEGWLLTAEMAEFLASGVDNVVCLQPFGCLPNHITGRGTMGELRNRFPKANLIGIDFEGGTAESNVFNRLKLFMTRAPKPIKSRRRRPSACGIKAARRRATSRTRRSRQSRPQRGSGSSRHPRPSAARAWPGT